MTKLREDIETHDIVVLLKIGEKFGEVLELIREMGIEENCALAVRAGLPKERLFGSLAKLQADDSLGNLSTMLIRKEPREKRY